MPHKSFNMFSQQLSNLWQLCVCAINWYRVNLYIHISIHIYIHINRCKWGMCVWRVMAYLLRPFIYTPICLNTKLYIVHTYHCQDKPILSFLLLYILVLTVNCCIYNSICIFICICIWICICRWLRPIDSNQYEFLLDSPCWLVGWLDNQLVTDLITSLYKYGSYFLAAIS